MNVPPGGHTWESKPHVLQRNSEPRHDTSIDSDRVDRRYRVLAIATDLDDLLWFAGGWMFDRASAGWTVDVVVTSQHSDHRPLTILGANPIHLTAITSPSESTPPLEVLIAVSSVHREGLSRDYAREAFDRGNPDITIWGAIRDTDSAPLRTVTHHLSPAARAFKIQALLAAGRRVDTVASTEQMWAPRSRRHLKNLLTSGKPHTKEQ